MADWRAVFDWITDRVLISLEYLAQLFLGLSRNRADVRFLFLTGFFATAWAVFALTKAPSGYRFFEPGVVQAQVRYVACTFRYAIVSDASKYNKDQRCYAPEIGRSYTRRPLVFELPFRLMFAAGIFRHVLLGLFAGWAAFRVVSEYMRGLYQLRDSRIADHYLLQTALINPYNVLRIREGFVDNADRNLPVQLIGGPGLVNVQAENAALFERIDGSPRVIGPTIKNRMKMEVLEGFERQRTIIDLRDQRDKFDVPGRSQDGIRVTAEDVQVVYSIFRDGQAPSYARPYPFQDPEAVENLVYLQGTGPWNIVMGVQIRGELWDFYANHPLNDFLSMIQQLDTDRQFKREVELERTSRRLMGETDEVDETPPESGVGRDFMHRPDITEQFWRGINRRSPDRGTQINWIGVGTWRFPTQLILGRHREAWQITHDNQIRSKTVVLNALQNQQRLYEMQRLIQSVPIATFRTLNPEEADVDDLMRGLLLAYHNLLNDAFQDFERQIEVTNNQLDALRSRPASADRDLEQLALDKRHAELTEQMDRIRVVLAYLSRFTGRWAGK